MGMFDRIFSRGAEQKVESKPTTEEGDAYAFDHSPENTRINPETGRQEFNHYGKWLEMDEDSEMMESYGMKKISGNEIIENEGEEKYRMIRKLKDRECFASGSGAFYCNSQGTMWGNKNVFGKNHHALAGKYATFIDGDRQDMQILNDRRRR